MVLGSMAVFSRILKGENHHKWLLVVSAALNIFGRYVEVIESEATVKPVKALMKKL